MSATEKMQPKQFLLLGLIILLVVIVGIQTWYLAGMKKQMDNLHTQQSAVQQQAMAVIENNAESNNAAPADNTPASNTSASNTTTRSTTTPAGSSAAAASPSANNSSALNPPPASMKPLSPPKVSPTPLSPPTQQARPYSPPSLFDDDFFNTPFDAQNWNPYEEIQRMQRDMDRLFNNAFSRFNRSPDFQHLFSQGVSTPEMDVQEDERQYTVIVNLPGADEKTVTVNLDGQVLTVKGEQDYSKQDKDAMGNVIYQERRRGSFRRSITLPEPVKNSGMKTDVDKGVLTITIPKDIP